jgi:competence CoiA-like predicted nuclease
MFKSINKSSGRPVVILDPQWDSQIDVLRTLANQNVLVCQECNQPVRVRAGGELTAGREGKKFIRRHFAHKNKLDCTYGSESYKILKARAVLYDFLYSKFGEKVTLEKSFDDEKVYRAIDCWVEINGKIFAYWILDGGMKAQRREELSAIFDKNGIHIHWIFDASVLKVDDKNEKTSNLSTTERYFMRSSQYDITPDKWKVGKSLHYIDSDNHKFITYRALRLEHAPQQYGGHSRCSMLDELLVSPTTGEIVHPGEHQLFNEYQEKERIRNELKKTQDNSFNSYSQSDFSSKRNYGFVYDYVNEQQGDDRKFSDVQDVAVENSVMLKCKICGEITDSWWMADFGDNTCKCNKCYGIK